MRVFRILYSIFLFFIVAELLPKQAKEPYPRLWGKIEGTTGLDHTGFAFTPYQGQGNCRIVNARLAFNTPGSKIVFGMLTPLHGKSYPHLWVTDANNKILDLSCLTSIPNCQNRAPFAIIDPITLTLDMKNPTTAEDIHQISWGLEYLHGIKDTLPAK